MSKNLFPNRQQINTAMDDYDSELDDLVVLLKTIEDASSTMAGASDGDPAALLERVAKAKKTASATVATLKKIKSIAMRQTSK